MFSKSISTPITKSSTSVSISEIGSKPICKNCKHFIPPKIGKDLNIGHCAKVGYMNLIDGEITYEYVRSAREFHCKGEMYEEK